MYVECIARLYNQNKVFYKCHTFVVIHDTDIHNIILRKWDLLLWNLDGFNMTVNGIADHHVNLSTQNKLFQI